MRKKLSRTAALFCGMAILLSTGGVWATWTFTDSNPEPVSTDLPLYVNEFTYITDMPEKEANFLERLYDILNNNYTNDTIPEGESLQYIIDTMNKGWYGENPLSGSFVGNMDPSAESKERIDVMFGDCIDDSEFDHVSFILKSENLIGDEEEEIAVYSTPDPLTWTPNSMVSVVGVYLSVFVPVRDEEQHIVAYELVCDSIHGYCLEVSYMDGVNIPSFSTDHWRDELFYWHESYAEVQPITGEDRYKYECYHPADGCYAYPGRTISWSGWIEVETRSWEVGPTAKGKKAWQKLEEILSSQA